MTGPMSQKHAIADSSLAPSLLTVAATLPSTYDVSLTDSAFSRRFTRIDAQYSRTSTVGVPSMLILGLRSDDVSRDSTGWTASVFGIRTGLAQKANGSGDVTLSAIELYFGGRTLGHLERRGWPNIGMEAVAGGAAWRRGRVLPSLCACRSSSFGRRLQPSGNPARRGAHAVRARHGRHARGGRGVSVTAGAQHMFARSQQPRFTLALGLGG